MASLSRQLAQWVVGLRYDDLPPAVVDRAKGVTLHSLASVLLGSEAPVGQQAVQLIVAPDGGEKLDENLLGNVFGQIVPPHDAIRGTKDGVVMKLKESSQSRHIPSLTLQDRLLLFQLPSLYRGPLTSSF